MPETIALLAIVFAPMLVEAQRAARNERVQRARGGIEPPGDVYDVMRVAYPAVFLAMIAEGAGARPARVSAAYARVAAVRPVCSSSPRRSSGGPSSRSGASWTFRVIVVPGDAPVASGPYAWLRHPNYVAVAFELVAVALMSGARVRRAAGGTLPVLARLMLKRIAGRGSALRAPSVRSER